MSQSAGKELVGPLSLTDEEYREYDFGGRLYRIDKPVALYYRVGGSTHRVVDSQGVTHCVPAPTTENACVLRWKASPNPVSF